VYRSLDALRRNHPNEQYCEIDGVFVLMILRKWTSGYYPAEACGFLAAYEARERLVEDWPGVESFSHEMTFQEFSLPACRAENTTGNKERPL
jgi:hypothetical protein